MIRTLVRALARRRLRRRDARLRRNLRELPDALLRDLGLEPHRIAARFHPPF